MTYFVSRSTFLITNIIPSCTRLSYHLRTPRTTTILKNAISSFLREQIGEKRRSLSVTEKETYKLHLQLSNKLHPYIWAKVDQITA